MPPTSGGVEHIGILDPTLALGQAFEVTAADLRALDLIGYDVVVVPLPAAWALLAPALALLISRRGGALRQPYP